MSAYDRLMIAARRGQPLAVLQPLIREALEEMRQYFSSKDRS